jgi:hypothetical protein
MVLKSSILTCIEKQTIFRIEEIHQQLTVIQDRLFGPGRCGNSEEYKTTIQRPPR